uniref:Uncharacterized protein n=1 Tax=Anguilla anguilla TaxID=7936 RepID=A0A0E9XXN9_ANGAN
MLCTGSKQVVRAVHVFILMNLILKKGYTMTFSVLLKTTFEPGSQTPLQIVPWKTPTTIT